MYSFEFSETAEKQFYKFNREVQKRIISTLERIKIRPYSYILRLVNSPYFRLRVGEYRLILDIKENKLTIFIIEIRHRKKYL
ncbi:type II toxin-antitoxin system RelE/ParE family toxin [Candidatus Woesearchaeota archaeon]|nr:type II toxin-antitoxin system RelE/ParE family toxin [Candidatus Woesearchaeota archaeon]